MIASSSTPELNLSIARIAISHSKMVWLTVLGIVYYSFVGIGVELYGLRPAFSIPLVISVVVLFVYLAVWVFRLARELYGRSEGLTCATLMCIPPLALPILLVLCFRAVSVLGRFGYRVGFLGLKRRELDAMKCNFNPLWAE